MSRKNTQWQEKIPEELVSSDQIHVWRIPLNIGTLEIEQLLKILSGDEVIKANRFRFEKDQKRFIAARGALRRILGYYNGQHPAKIEFSYGTNGKPQLKAALGLTMLQFNLSHSDAFALCAVSLRRKVGVDIERIRHDVAAEQTASCFFSPNEANYLKSIPKTSLHKTFFRFWTRKEALLKATGDGILFPMDKVDVSMINDQVQTPIALPGVEKENTQWYVQDIFPGEGYAAAVAVEGVCGQLTLLQYSL